MPPTENRSAVAAALVGVLSIVLFFPFGPFIGAVAIAMGRKARREAMRGAPGKGAATAGIVLGAIGLVAGVIFFILASACDCL
jgi:hypothetical protein